jgi:putative oxidoreductase
MYNNRERDQLAKLLLRLTVAVFMLFHGYSKIMSPGALDWIGGTLSGYGLPTVLAYGVYVGEILAPILLIIGVYCRIGGWLIFLNMLFAIFLAHQSELFTLSGSGGWALELQGFYLMGGLVVALSGSGKLALRPD